MRPAMTCHHRIVRSSALSRMANCLVRRTLSATSNNLVGFVDQDVNPSANSQMDVDIVEFESSAHLSSQVPQLHKFEMATAAKPAGVGMLHCPASLTPEGFDTHMR